MVVDLLQEALECCVDSSEGSVIELELEFGDVDGASIALKEVSFQIGGVRVLDGYPHPVILDPA